MIFCCCDETPWSRQLIKERIYLAHGSRGIRIYHGGDAWQQETGAWEVRFSQPSTASRRGQPGSVSDIWSLKASSQWHIFSWKVESPYNFPSNSTINQGSNIQIQWGTVYKCPILKILLFVSFICAESILRGLSVGISNTANMVSLIECIHILYSLVYTQIKETLVTLHEYEFTVIATLS